MPRRNQRQASRNRLLHSPGSLSGVYLPHVKGAVPMERPGNRGRRPDVIASPSVDRDYDDEGLCARRKERIWRTARGIRSLGSFHGNMLTSAFGASIAASMATAYGCAGISSGRISTGVWQLRTKSRVTVKTKSGLVRYILVRNLSTISMVISGRRLTNSGPQPVILVS